MILVILVILASIIKERQRLAWSMHSPTACAHPPLMQALPADLQEVRSCWLKKKNFFRPAPRYLIGCEDPSPEAWLTLANQGQPSQAA